ncbi:PREDICTED: ribonuclease P [Prunus dulcis]|uniref:PREDICTED: ribonuclease P n=1 Tax=Prunus dulcis TaxID=3755 RepID=A0A5E4F5R9_PRUDU|nr:uncharacterized protein LOC117621481 [Prunus dulcis]KAI5336172.1 hypothetical protein L3X38_015438 [Prunus dulcis]VVA21108.1 PREDICTED: ribonuclease P [Prunus dulcis]
MPPRNKDSKGRIIHASKSQDQDCYEGERLDRLLQSIQRKIESARLDSNCLPEKMWFKQQFAIGVNEVTRVLERMPPVTPMVAPSLASNRTKAPYIGLQAVLIASDCNPRWLSKHLPSLALSRKVPLIFLKDNKGASLRLGQLVQLKTAIAIGVKAKGNAINQLIEEILRGNTIQLGIERLNSTPMLTTAHGQVQR